MTFAKFKHVKISGLIGVLPEKCINIDDEIQYFKNNPSILERNKKILGLGKRYFVKDGTTASDLFESAAVKLIEKHKIDIDKIEALVVVSISHDYRAPATACILHGRLGLNENCLCYDIAGLACSGYIHGLLNVYSLIESGIIKNCLLLTGGLESTHSNVKNRKTNILFSDSGTATFIEHTEQENESYFYLGTQGKDWDKIISPASGEALPIRKDIADLEIVNNNHDVWHLWEILMQGMEVFKFAMEIGPKSISELLKYSNKTMDDIDFFAIHQANKQIVRTVATHSRIPKEKYSTETFTKYANCSTASVVSVILDQVKNKNDVLLCTFGVGLSFASAIINFSETKNYGFETYISKNLPTRKEQIDYWVKLFLET